MIGSLQWLLHEKKEKEKHIKTGVSINLAVLLSYMPKVLIERFTKLTFS